MIFQTITRSSQALKRVIDDYIEGKLSTPIHSAYITRGVATTQAREAKEIAGIPQTVERSSSIILAALSKLVDSFQEPGKEDNKAATNDQFIADGICVVVKNFVGILSSLHKNSMVLLSATLSAAPPTGNRPIKDIRLELTMIIIRQLTNLNLELDYQRNILEGTLYHILEITGGILLNSFADVSGGSDEAKILRLAMEETSWYLLRILEATLPIMACSLRTGNGKLEDKARKKLKNMLVKGLFGSKTDETAMAKGRGKEEKRGLWECLEGSRFCGDASIIESPFSRALWDILGLDMFSSDE